MDIIRPEVDGRFDYLMAKHKPCESWYISPGRIIEVSVLEDRFEVEFELDREDAVDHSRFCPQLDGVMVTLFGSNQFPILEEWVKLKRRDHIQTKLGLKRHE